MSAIPTISIKLYLFGVSCLGLLAWLIWRDGKR
ncbi:hypothetical protein C7440_2278 [Pusillimonas noertemannii]|uniref:Uncharacterized protein n=1 Tax=Pusillimonas noertemannii TaxID=305977 RepID=A0A2U1CKN3_9BURK|nr:hypothetical protein C7440_2278 [Pusillimonas noertemannii]